MPKTQDPRAQLDDIIIEARNKFGNSSLHYAAETLPINRVPFMEPQLNYVSRGGAPFGRFLSFSGHPLAGKSRVALELIAQAQQLPHSAEVTLIPRIAYHIGLSHDTSLDDSLREKHEKVAKNLELELEWVR